MKFYTLIHVCKDEQSLHNNGFGTSFDDQIKLYFSCAQQLHRSLKEEGVELVVLTNDAAFLRHINNGSYLIEVVQIDFVLKVPSGLKFYSAHFKIEVYQYLSLLDEDYVGLIDCDMICINKMPACLRNAINYRAPLYYDITDQMAPAFGAERIIRDKQQLGKTNSIGLWAGGEFICGKPSFFSVLYAEIERIKNEYFENFNSFHHQGDEMLTSVAIERLMLTSDLRILDAGVMSIVGRYWSYKPLHRQKAIEAYTDHFLIHIPSDKKFIAGLKVNELKAKAFLKSYKKHLFKSHFIENTLGGFRPYVKKSNKKAYFSQSLIELVQMKKAYVIMAHKNPRQLYRLLSKLNDGVSEFFIHIDKTAEFSQFDIVKDFRQIVHFVDRVDSKWGGFGSVQASLNGLQAVRDSKIHFDRILLLSGQDYPIKNNEYINDFFKNSPYSVFMDIFPIPNYGKWPGSDRGGWYRVDKYYIGLKWYEFFCSKSLNLLSTYLPFLRRKIPNGMKPFTGSQWWCVDMYALNYILDYDKQHPEYRAFHQFTFVPDELYVQMIIANSRDEKLNKSVDTNNKRLMIWEQPDSSHPNILRATDLETIKASDHLFARKFDEQVDASILDRIDREILSSKSGANTALASGE